MTPQQPMGCTLGSVLRSRDVYITRDLRTEKYHVFKGTKLKANFHLILSNAVSALNEVGNKHFRTLFKKELHTLIVIESPGFVCVTY